MGHQRLAADEATIVFDQFSLALITRLDEIRVWQKQMVDASIRFVESIEWSGGWAVRAEGRCPVCKGTRKSDHRPNCGLMSHLRELRGMRIDLQEDVCYTQKG